MYDIAVLNRGTRGAQTSDTNVDCHPDGNQFRKMKFDFWIGYDF